jgi:hypothetical protein
LIHQDAKFAVVARKHTKWVKCADWRRTTKVSRLLSVISAMTPVSRSYEKRIGIHISPDPVRFRWWSRIHCKTKQLSLLDTALHLRLDASRRKERSCSGAVIYDDEGRKYSTDALTLEEIDPITGELLLHEIRPEPCQTVQSYCAAAFNFDIENVLPDLMESILHRISCRMAQRLDGRKPRVVVESRKIHTVFCTPEELDILHECCEIVPFTIANDVERASRTLHPSEIHEMALRLHALPPPLHQPVLRWVLSVVGVGGVNPSLQVDRLCAMVVLMEKLTNRMLDLPTAVEIQHHVRQEMRGVAAAEATERERILQEEMMWWRRVSPSFVKVTMGEAFVAEGLSADTAAMASAAPAEISLEAADADKRFRFVLSDTTIISFRPSPMSFQRGDVIEYSLGDIAGLQAVILGMESGRLWRY